MENSTVIFTVFLIFMGATIFSTLALYIRQSLLVAYMLFGISFGPWGLKAIADLDLVNRIDEIGVIFFMFLLGLQLHPQNVLKMIGRTAWITLASSSVFFILGFAVSFWYGYSLAEDFIIGICMMFSSTVISLKLLAPEQSGVQAATQLTNEIMTSMLLLQDFIAIVVLLGITIMSNNNGSLSLFSLLIPILSLPLIICLVFIFERLILRRFFSRFADTHEYILLLAVSWCLGIAELAGAFKLSHEIGAFLAGISIAASPLANYITKQLKPIRDFFLVLFFFIIGASFNLSYLNVIILPTLILTVIFVLLKPWIFSLLLHPLTTNKALSWEIGIRLGQLSEFSLLVIFLAYRNELISHSVIYLVQAVTMLMFIISSYWVVLRYSVNNRPIS